MAMTQEQMTERATERAIQERLHTFKVVGQPLYLVRSRKTEPGAMQQVHVTEGQVDHCTCASWKYREFCTHAAAVTRRLKREGKSSRHVTDTAAA